MFLHNVGPIFFNIRGWAFIRGSIFFGNLLEKSAFLASKLGNWPLLEHDFKVSMQYYLAKMNRKPMFNGTFYLVDCFQALTAVIATME